MFAKYLWYLAKHKFFVFKAGLKTKAPLWNLIVHDWSKFLPDEFFPYMRYFYGKYPSIHDGKVSYLSGIRSKESTKVEFDYAWNLHQKRNPHHWQYWVLVKDTGETVALDMPEVYIREMIADWMGAGRAITGRWEVKEWYEKNKNKIILNPYTRIIVEQLIK